MPTDASLTHPSGSTPASIAPEVAPDRAAATSVTLASLLRWLGGGALALSALVYMLQGVEQIDLQLRNWVYLILMGLLCGGGVLSRLVMEDAKSARLFFGLAAALVPVQFSQLGGMVFELFAVAPAPLAGGVEAVSAVTTAAVSAVTLALSVPVVFAGFSVLARQEAKSLCLIFLVVNSVLLLPMRTSAAGMLVLVALAVAALAMEQGWFGRRPVYRTLEGKAIRAMFVLPLVIALARAGFHADTLAGYCALGGVASLVAIGGSRHWTAGGPLRELLLFGGTLLGAISWMFYTIDILQWHYNAYQLIATLLPMAVLLITAGTQSDNLGRIYRTLGSALVAYTAYLLLSWETTATAALTALLIATGLLAWGIRLRYREPTLVGGGTALVSLVCLGILAVTDINTSTWVMLAGVGLISVLAASVVERFGRRLLSAARNSWEDVSGWH